LDILQDPVEAPSGGVGGEKKLPDLNEIRAQGEGLDSHYTRLLDRLTLIGLRGNI
jgi:hypothetical protein